MNDFYSTVEQVFHDWRYDNPKILYGLIRSLKPAVVVEVGMYRGYSASWMAKALQENGTGHLYGIDNFSLTEHVARYGDPRAHLESNLRTLGVRDTITILEGDSDKVLWPVSVDFAYIDGFHSYLTTWHDFQQCAQQGAECICFDDTTQSVGPRLLMGEIRERGQWDVIDVRRDCGMTICMRRKVKGPITFSQELPDNPGVDLQQLTDLEQQLHLSLAQRTTGVDYAPIMDLLCEGRAE